jgi:hypothetical protein
VRFYLTDKNNEDMEGFNDVWANILNDDLLNAKELNNVYLLEPRVSELQPSPPRVDTLALGESSLVECLVPRGTVIESHQS